MTTARPSVPIPAETGVEDRLAGSLTFRHAAYLAAAAAGVALMVLGGGSPLRIVAGAALALVALAGAVLRPYGEPLDRLAPAAVAYLRRHRHETAEAVPDTVEPEVEAPRTARARKVRAQPVEETPRAADDTAPVEEDAPPARTRRRLPWGPVVAGLAAVAVVAVAVVRWPRPDPVPPVTRIVVVPLPVPAPDPWEEEIDDAVDAWVADNLGG